MRDNNPNRKDSYQWSLGHIYTISTELENCVNRAINVNLDVCKELARIQLNSNLLSDSRFVKLHKQSNYFALLPSKYVSQQIDLEHKDNTQFCSQRSPIWYKLCQRSFVTGSSMYKGLGLDTLKAEKEHFNVYVRKLPSVPVSEEVQKYIQFGSENEINAIASLVGLIMPDLLPSCFSFFEVGPQFIHGVHRENLIKVSADGIINCTHGESCLFRQTKPNHHKKK